MESTIFEAEIANYVEDVDKVTAISPSALDKLEANVAAAFAVNCAAVDDKSTNKAADMAAFFAAIANGSTAAIAAEASCAA